MRAFTHAAGCYNLHHPLTSREGATGRVEKLEQILHAEEQARRALADAKVRARTLRGQAATDAEQVIAAAGREASEKAATATDAIMRDANAEATRIEAQSQEELVEFLKDAERRLPDAVRAVLGELEG